MGILEMVRTGRVALLRSNEETVDIAERAAHEDPTVG
jgi:hypothetical protein